jgi:hypothetical protein
MWTLLIVFFFFLGVFFMRKRANSLIFRRKDWGY